MTTTVETTLRDRAIDTAWRSCPWGNATRVGTAAMIDAVLALPELQALSSPNAGKAYAHPTRPRIMALIADHGSLSPVGAHRELADVPLGTVAYHFRALKRLGVIRQVGARQRRGAAEHFYAYTEPGR